MLRINNQPKITSIQLQFKVVEFDKLKNQIEDGDWENLFMESLFNDLSENDLNNLNFNFETVFMNGNFTVDVAIKDMKQTDAIKYITALNKQLIEEMTSTAQYLI